MLCNSAWGTTYYLNADSGNDSNDGLTAAEAWQTLNKSRDTVLSGDTIKMFNGNYGEYNEAFGSAIARTDWVTYEPNDGQTQVIFERIAVTSSDQLRDSYLRFQNITVDTNDEIDDSTGFFIRGSSFWEIIDCNIIGDGYNPNIAAGIDNAAFFLRATTNVLIDGCKVYGDGTPFGSDNNGGISLGGKDFSDMGTGYGYGILGNLPELGQACVDINIVDCNFAYCGVGIAIQGSDWHVNNNNIHHVSWDGVKVNNVNTVASGLTGRIIFSNNIIWYGVEHGSDLEGSPENRAHFDGIQFGSTEINHITVKKNIIRDIDGDALFCKGDIAGLDNTDWVFENNLIHNTLSGVYEDIDFFLTCRIYNCSDAVFRNNTVDGTVTAEIEGSFPGVMTYSVFANNMIKYIAMDTDEPGNAGAITVEAGNVYKGFDGLWTAADMDDFDFSDSNFLVSPSTDYTVTGTLNPDATGAYSLGGTVNGENYYTRTADSTYSIWFDTGFGFWFITITSDIDDVNFSEGFWVKGSSGVAGSYPAGVIYTGTATVTQVETIWEDQFTDYDANDFTLDAASAGIDFGNTNYSSPEDILGNLRPEGSLVDSGAYESGAGTDDTFPPVPNPATFATPPTVLSSSSVTMTATAAEDATGPVEYFFTETGGGDGATNSEWQESPIYIDTGLSTDVVYTYTVQTRDSIPNTGTVSSGFSVTISAGGYRGRLIDGYRAIYRSRYR